ETEPSDEEIDRQIAKLKKGKAEGGDEIKNEAWIYGRGKIRCRIREIIREVWRGEYFPEDWREGIITPIFKKGEKDCLDNYRGVTLTSTAYKIYASILNERILKSVEEKEGFEENLAGFRKGRGCMDHVFTLKHWIDKIIKEKGGAAYVLFLDLRAAFDKLDRVELLKAMENIGLEEGLIEQVRRIYKETKCRVRVGGELSEGFWTKKGVRQGCPLSPTLFNIYVADMEDHMRRRQVGGRKIWTLAYADDTAMVAESEEEMREMMKLGERYFKKRKLEVNVGKTKMMKFSKGGGRGRRKKRTWKWEGEDIEEVKNFSYLGYIFMRNNVAKDHVKERVRTARQAMGRVWGLGERKFGGRLKWRTLLFNSIVKSILMYGAELWGWNERKEVERLQEQYGRWIM
ncbi:GSCOCG00009629001-RA-CDS, partial [Cotesia congregata]